MAPLLASLLLLLLPTTALADCWTNQHPTDPRPATLRPIPPTWRRPDWGHVPPSATSAAVAARQRLLWASPPDDLRASPSEGRRASPAKTCSVLAHGGKADNRTLNTAAIHAALAECAGAGSALLPGPGVSPAFFGHVCSKFALVLLSTSSSFVHYPGRNPCHCCCLPFAASQRCSATCALVPSGSDVNWCVGLPERSDQHDV